MSDGKTFDEIGKELGVTKQQAKNIFDAAIQKLKLYLRRHPEEADVLWNFLEGSPDPKGHGKYREIE